MFPALFNSRMTHKATLTSQATSLNEFGEKSFAVPITNIRCFADGSKTSTLRDGGVDFGISFRVQFGKTHVIVPGDKLTEVKTQRGDVLFSLGIVRRVEPLIDSAQGIIGRLCSVQVKKA